MSDVFDFIVFFFFKQKTAYEMRISDWSSDVCSSDLVAPRVRSNSSFTEIGNCMGPDAGLSFDAQLTKIKHKSTAKALIFINHRRTKYSIKRRFAERTPIVSHANRPVTLSGHQSHRPHELWCMRDHTQPWFNTRSN